MNEHCGRFGGTWVGPFGFARMMTNLVRKYQKVHFFHHFSMFCIICSPHLCSWRSATTWRSVLFCGPAAVSAGWRWALVPTPSMGFSRKGTRTTRSLLELPVSLVDLLSCLVTEVGMLQRLPQRIPVSTGVRSEVFGLRYWDSRSRRGSSS